jgi:hypothetical protein
MGNCIESTSFLIQLPITYYQRSLPKLITSNLRWNTSPAILLFGIAVGAGQFKYRGQQPTISSCRAPTIRN